MMGSYEAYEVDTQRSNAEYWERRATKSEARLAAVESAAKDLLAATGHYTWDKLFKAPTVERAITLMKEALKCQ